MYIMVGLGNPEPEYARTRHNMGFDTINKIANEFNIQVEKRKYEALYGIGTIQGEKVILIKPQTYMNLSGKSLREFMNFYHVKKEELIVIYDDMDIEKGTIKIRKKGGSGSHNGMKSIIQEIGTEAFARIRVGIGTPEYKNDKVNFVIGKVSEEEYQELEKGINNAVLAIQSILENGIEKAMNQYN